VRYLAIAWCVSLAARLFAQDTGALPEPTVHEKWRYFVSETFAPVTLGAAAFNAGVSQVTNSTPLYGQDALHAYPKRFGAAAADIAGQNFFGDFVMASALHEDTRYRRLGESHRLWTRVGYAISRALVTHKDSGEWTFNWSNVTGTAMSAALSNAYYPAASRNATAAATNWATDVAGSGFANLMPEFWPDVSRWAHRRFHLRR